MESLESAAGQKCTREHREKNLLQRKWVSEPTASAKRSTFADSQGKRHSQREGNQSSDGGTTGSLEKCTSGTPPSPAGSQSSHEKTFLQQFPGTYFHQLPRSYPQQSAQEALPAGVKPQLQPGLDAQAWPFAGQLQALTSEDLLPPRSRGHGGGFPHRKSPTFPFSKYPQAGREQPEDVHKKEQKPKKPGKYICHYCGRACAKPSVLKKHIRSHTGERPYPCVPCGFSFKTKSNLYKHRKSHAHAIKAGLVPCSELVSARVDADQAGEAEVHSDGELSTDTDEDTAEGLALLGKNSPLPYAPFEADRSTMERDGGETASTESGEERAGCTAKVPLLIVPKQGTMLAAVQSPKFVETETISPVGPREGAGDEFHSVKQRLALRLHEKKVQDSESSFNLLSPHSKGSTDSGYFSRSESTEQQVSPPITNAKSYEEIMFGKYYRPSPRPRQSITVAMATVGHKDTNVTDLTDKPSVMHELGMGKISEDRISHLYAKDENMVDSVNLNTNIFLRGALTESQRAESFHRKQYPANSSQVNTVLLEAPSDTGSLTRSNSMPTSSATNLDVPQGIRGSHSFDERMTSDDVFYPGTGGLRRLRRQAAFELSAHEGHAESDSHGTKSITPPSVTVKTGEHCAPMAELRGYGSYGTKVGMEGYPEIQSQLMYQRQVMETATRKRRKEKSVGDEDDSPSHYASDHSVEMLGSPGDYDSKQVSQDTLRSTPTGKGHLHNVHSQSDSIDMGTSAPEDRMFIQDSDRKTPVNVISVIQHTNSLSRPSSFEKSDSVDYPSYLQGKSAGSYSEYSDSENTEEVQSMDSLSRSESIEQQQSETDTAAQNRHVAHKLVRQPNIQVPEIRVTEEPDKPEKVPEVQVKEPEKHVEEFQWPQRSETLAQLPAEKLPPKKKRLRLAELEHSSGESSFESTCTSLSRSPSQDSNLSHSSSLSMSFDREDGVKSASPMKQEDPSKQSEFLTVPGSGHTLSIPNPHHQREMRRSSSEQAPSALPSEDLETRSKSFDYGSLSSSSRQGEVYASASSMKERRRGYLVRQASLSVHPETGLDMNIKQEHLEQMHSGLHRGAPLPLVGSAHGTPVSDVARNKRNAQPALGLHNRPLQQSANEDDRKDSHLLIQKSYNLPGWQPSESDRQRHERSSQEVTWHSTLAQSPFLPFQPGVFWHPESTQWHKEHFAFQTHQLQKLHIRHPSAHQPHYKLPQSPQLQQIQEHGDSEPAEFVSDQSYQCTPRALPHHLSNLLSKVYSESPVPLHERQAVLSTQSAVSQPSLPGMLVPVRVQTNVPSYGSATYTSVSQILAAHDETASSVSALRKATDDSQSSLPNTDLKQRIGLSLSQILGPPGVLSPYPFWKVPEPLPVQLNTGIPLSLTCGTILTTDASSMGSGKRMLSPASSLELFTEIKQQKRVKEEKMYGQIVEELSAVELGNSGAASDSNKSQKPGPQKSEGPVDYREGMTTPPPSNVPLPSCPSQEVRGSGHFTPPRPMQTDTPDGRESPEELEVDEPIRESGSSQDSTLSAGSTQEVRQVTDGKMWGAAAFGGSSPPSADVQRIPRYPSLRTTASVSWCFLNYTKPNDTPTTPHSSVYASWCVSSNNPNPPSLNTKTALALLCSKQWKNTETYTMAAMSQPGTGKLVSSYLWKQKFDQVKPELMQLDMNKFEKKLKGISCRDRVKEGQREVSSKQTEPTRIKIFEGGYKSNEDYIYVRGRGRGKYICEECGIRCKKPSMLKKHIRSHTDVRPYVCKFCNFAFKTKGNLTKHMKSKAHMKKCLELGVPVTSVDDGEPEEADNVDEGHRDSGKTDTLGVVAEHQFSDADDSEGAEEEGDEIEEDDDDDDEYDGDSTPKTRSRSTSPHPYGMPSLPRREFPGPAPKPPLCSYFLSLPSIQITPLAVSGEQEGELQSAGDQKHLQGSSMTEDHEKNLDVPTCMEEDRGLSPSHASAGFDSSPSRLSSPGCDSSPCRDSSPTSRRYLSPRRDLSPRGRLSPRREASPLRHISPKRRDLSPRRHLSPVTPRELSPRSRHRGMIRAVSPRRGSHRHLHSAPWDMGQYLLPDTVSLGQESRKSGLQGLRLSVDLPGTRDPTAVGNRGLFSHLPLHSQRQVRTPLPMIPIGGIQVVHSAPASGASSAPPSQLPPQKSTWEEPSQGEVSFQPQEDSSTAAGMEDTLQRNKKLPFPRAAPALPGMGSPSPWETDPSKQDGAGGGDEDGRQDESVQTCTRAIASLRIATEERPAEIPDPRDSRHQRPSPAEGMQVGTQHSGSECQRLQADAVAVPTDPSSEKDKPSPSVTPPSHVTICSKSANERLLEQQTLREMSTSAKTGNDSPKEVMDYR